MSHRYWIVGRFDAVHRVVFSTVASLIPANTQRIVCSTATLYSLPVTKPSSI
ncbi:hypothetical protein HBI25_057850 [Parastagonospora nodorum]|nr:hypothetical protein HBH53_054530 [Parastagonospora nodorum]KAH3981876.1 hypothetical protein HBH51_040610 [Parastagonospora nodorum]KAH3994875.1 hypothetical protein HBI10_180510 [Parastagonospora nodorum]KAH4015013.1 hypothetical protein HBI13_165640 [Parastagonospora nodorum]KAH4024463.1 hypothetical protein HBI09_161070 [Parastagonospora nodorum]